MKQLFRKDLFGWLFLLFLAAQPFGNLSAQTVRSSEEIMEALRGQGVTTRGLRNLSIKKAEQVAQPVNPPTQPESDSTRNNAPEPEMAQITPSNQETVAVPVPPQKMAAPAIDLVINFDINSSQLTKSGILQFEELKTALLSPELRVRKYIIEGHTDSSGSVSINERLSGARAQAIKDLLASAGFPMNQLQAVGLGSRHPLSVNNTLAAENRRVRVIAVSEK